MKLNETKFLEELRQIEGEIKSAYFEFSRIIIVIPPESILEQRTELEKARSKREWEFYDSTHKAYEKLSYLLSLVAIDPLEALIDKFYPQIQDILSEATKTSSPQAPFYITEATKLTPMANAEAITQ